MLGLEAKKPEVKGPPPCPSGNAPSVLPHLVARRWQLLALGGLWLHSRALLGKRQLVCGLPCASDDYERGLGGAPENTVHGNTRSHHVEHISERTGIGRVDLVRSEGSGRCGIRVTRGDVGSIALSAARLEPACGGTADADPLISVEFSCRGFPVLD